MKAVVTAFFLLFTCVIASSQSVNNYTFAASAGTFTALSGATPVTLTSGNADDGYINGLPIGFDFWYMGTRYTTASVSTNGWITLGSNITDDVISNDISNGGAPRPVIAPLWDDIAFSLASNISYNTTGTTGNRVFTVQYLNARWDYSANANCISFQVKLHEATGRITFVYRTSLETGALVAPSASIGITAAATGSGNFRSLNSSGAAPTVSSVTATNTIASKPANGQTYTFTPPVPTTPGSLSFTAVTASSMTLNWTDLSTNERGFVVYRSTDGGVNYTFQTQVGAGTTSSVQSGLSHNTTYMWRVYAVSEGGLSNALSGSQATSCLSPVLSSKPTANLIAHYRFEGNATDETGNNNGTLVNGPTLTPDRFGIAGRAYTFNGTSQYVTTTNSYVNPTNFTISVWFRTNTTTGGKLMGFGNSQSGTSSSHDRALYMNNAGNLYFGVYYLSSTRTISSPLTYNDNNWHLATVTHSSTTGMKLYVDGVEVASNASYTGAENTTGYWRIGYDNLNGWPSPPSSYYFKGTMDDIHIYHGTLSPTDVALLYNAPDGASNNGPVCTNSPITLSATTLAGASYSWTGPNGFASTAQNPTFTFTTAAAGTYTVTATVPGCASPATAYTSVVSGPAGATFTSSTTPTCIGGSTGTITLVASGGATPYTYSINGGAYQSSATFTGLAAGSYTINVRTNAGCVSTASVNVNAFAASTDNQNAAATDSWIGHMYDGTGFSTYAGQFTEPENFVQSFGGPTVCFTVVSNSLTSSIYTETYSVKYRMNSTKGGLYIADLGSDDGSRLTVDGTLVYNNWFDQSFSVKAGVLFRLTGSSSLLYEFYENGGGNQVQFQNLTQVLANALSSNITQSVCAGNSGLAIGGDVFGTLPAGITLSGTGYQWTYSTSPGGVRTAITGATSATFTPSAAVAPFNTPGTYYLYRNAALSSVNNVSPNPYVATHESNPAVITVTALPSATISYSGTPYCTNGGAATVTRTGTAGGTYSSTAGLSIDPSTGTITPGSSTAGTYTVTYTLAAAGGCGVQTATTSVTITAAPSASFSYAGSPYIQNAGFASVTFSGTTGGVFSSTAGLSIHPATGQVTLATSTIGTYTVTYTVAASGGCSLYTTTASITINTGVKTFTGTGNFSDPARWTGNTLPVAGENLVIDGTCTVDNNATTNNVAYGTLTIGTATARTLTWAASGTNRLNVSDVTTGSATSSLNMANGGTLVIRGAVSIAALNFTPGTGTLEFQSNITLPPIPALHNLTVNGAGISVKLGAHTVLSGSLTITDGNFNSNGFNLSVARNWLNNASVSAFTHGTGTVTFNGTVAQTIGGTYATTFGNITVSSSGNTVSLLTNTPVTGNLSVTSGTFDLGIYTANRTAAGGTLSLSNGTLLRIAGTGTFPANFTTNTLSVASTVEYAGTNQVIASRTYGNLTLSSSSGAAVKTMPATSLTIAGNLTSSQGSGTSVSFTAGANMAVSGNFTIGTSTTFNGGSFTHTIGGNWVNAGTFTGSTSTVVFNGFGKNVSGAGVQAFNNVTISAASVTFSSNSINLSGNLATTGSGSFVQASGGTLTMTGAGKTITGTGIVLDNLSVPGSVSTASALTLTGNLAVNGSFTGTSGTVTMSGTSKSISGSGSCAFAGLSITGTITTALHFSISSSLNISGSFTATSGVATFTGTAVLSGAASLYHVTLTGTSLTLSANALLGVAGTLTLSAGALDVTSNTPNTVDFNGTGAQTVSSLTYHHLVVSNGNTKSLAGNVVTNGNITINPVTTLNPGAYTISTYGNWINNGTFLPATSNVEFVGPAIAHIYGVTTFNTLTSNTSSPTTDLILDNNVNATTVNMIQGIIATGANTLTITGTRTGNGYIFGNIQRLHSFTTGVDYAFEGPNNTINFSAVSGVNSITVTVVKGSVGDFPFGGSISRVYSLNVPAGTYTATLRLHYEDAELNGNNESSMALWNYVGSTWTAIGKTANSSTSNFVEYTGLTNLENRWTCSDNSNVVQWTGTVSSDWSVPGNWSVAQGSASLPPGASDIVNIGNVVFNNQPAITSPVTVKNIIFGSAKAVNLVVGTGGSLTTGDINGNWTANASHTLDVAGGTLSVSGDLSLSDGIAGHAINLVIGSGTAAISGSVAVPGDAAITFIGNGQLIVGEDFHCNAEHFTAGAGTVVYNGLGNQHIAHLNYNNLTINKGDGIAESDSATYIAGDLLLSDGTLDNLALMGIAGHISIQTGATFSNTGSIEVGGNWINNGTFVAGGTHVMFNGSGAQTISATLMDNLVINKPLGTEVMLTGNVTIGGSLEVRKGTLNIKTFTCDRLTPGGSMILADSATIIVGGNNAPVNFTAGSVSDSSTVIADGTIPQMIYGDRYGHLIFRNSGLKTLVSPLTINGRLEIEAGAIFNGGSQTLTLNGNWINKGTFVPSSGSIIFGGNTRVISGVSTFNEATVNGSYTILDNITFNSKLTITPTGVLSAAANIHTTMRGDLLNSGVLFTLGETTFTGDVFQTLSLVNAVQTVAMTVNFNGTISPILVSTSSPQFGFMNINNTGGITPSVGWTILYGLTVGTGASFHGGISTHNILGNLTNNGTISSSGVLNFVPTTNVSLNLGSNLSSSGTVVFGGSGVISLSGNAGSFHNVTVANTNAAGITSSSDWTIANDLQVNSGSVFNAGPRTYQVGGDLKINGTLNAGTSMFVLNGVETQELLSTSAFYDLAVIKSADSLLFLSPVSATGSFSMQAGKANLGAQTLTVTGRSVFSGGEINNGVINASGISSLFSGTAIGAVVIAASDSLYLNGSVFNNTATLTKNGVANISSTGGNIFNGTTSISATGSGFFLLGATNGDTFNGATSFTNSGSSGLYPAFNSPNNNFNGTTTFSNIGTGTGNVIQVAYGGLTVATFNGNIVFNNTSKGILFGAVGGKTNLASGRTMSIGATGFSAGTLHFWGFTQHGTTTQSLTLTGTALFRTGAATTYNANVNFQSPQLVLDQGNTFNGTTYLAKTGATQNNSIGGSVFNGNTTIANSGSGYLVLGYPTGVDIFNGDLTLTNTGSAGIYPAFNTPGHQFNGNIYVNQNTASNIYFCGGTGTATLAAGKTINVGSSGFNSGLLTLAQFTQLGNTAQSVTLGGTATMVIGPNATFNGNVAFSAPQFLLNGGTFHGTTVITKSGSTNNVSNGGNIFNGVTTLNCSGNGSFDLGNTSPDIFNNTLVVNNTAAGRLQLGIGSAGNIFNGTTTINHGGSTASLNTVVARNPGSSATFNGDLYLNCTNTNATSGIIIGNEGTVTINGHVVVSSTSGRGVLFSDAGGQTTLGSGFTITEAGANSFTTGILKLGRFIQAGPQSQALTLSGTATLQVGPLSEFNGAVNFSAPQLYLHGAHYFSTAILRKTGAGDNASNGGNVFDDAAVISNNGTGYFRLGNVTSDDFNSHATFVQTGSGLLQPAYASSCTIAGNLSTSGTATAISFRNTVTMNGTTAQAITSSLVPEFVNLTISNTGNVVTTGVNLAISGNLSLSSGSFDLGEFTANRTAGGGTLSLSNNTLLRIGGSNSLPANYTTHVVGATNTVEYAGDGQVVSHFNSGQTYGHLKISGTAAQTQSDVSVRNDLTVTGSFGINANTIKVGGALSNSGVFIVANGTVELNGTAAQTIPASVFTGNNVKGLTINNTAGVTLAGSLDLTDVLTVSNGSLDAGGFLTLKSTSTATARIAPITSLAPSPITGVVNAERYVPGRRKYRLVTSPVTTSAESVLAQGQEELSIWGNWQNFGNNTSANAGNFITGGSSADGFDTQTPNASLFTYDDVNRKYVGYTSANGKNTKYTPLKAGIAYYMFVYGDRRNTITTSNPNSTVLTARGTVLTGDQAYHTTSTIPLTGVVGRYTMLGNPFASPIDWATIPKTNLANTYWGWDPNLSGTGGYVTVSTLGEITITSPMSGVTGINQYIQSGQAFFVKTTAASPTMTIREQDKVANFNGSVFRTEGAPLTLIAANLQYTSGASRLLADGVVAVFDDNFSNSIGSEDASKMENTTEGLSISASGELLSIEGRRMPQLNDTIRLATARLTKPQYTLQLFTKEMGALTVAPFLYDSYQDTLVPILTTDTTRFDFSVNAALPASTDPNRFKIVFRKMVMLPVRFVSVKAEKKEEAVNVQWMVADESGIAHYDIERSDDGLNFRKAGEVAAGNNSHYNWLDTAPNTGNNYYRIRAVESGGNTILSNTVVVKMTGTAKAVSVIPNPVTDGQIHLYLEVQERGVYTITLHDRGGRLVLQKTMQHPGGRARATIDASSMARGMYYLSVTIKDNKYTEQVLIDR